MCGFNFLVFGSLVKFFLTNFFLFTPSLVNSLIHKNHEFTNLMRKVFFFFYRRRISEIDREIHPITKRYLKNKLKTTAMKAVKDK